MIHMSAHKMMSQEFSKGEGTLRSQKSLERELTTCMKKYDADGSGTLSVSVLLNNRLVTPYAVAGIHVYDYRQH